MRSPPQLLPITRLRRGNGPTIWTAIDDPTERASIYNYMMGEIDIDPAKADQQPAGAARQAKATGCAS
jgi:hypothetical protein